MTNWAESERLALIKDEEHRLVYSRLRSSLLHARRNLSPEEVQLYELRRGHLVQKRRRRQQEVNWGQVSRIHRLIECSDQVISLKFLSKSVLMAICANGSCYKMSIDTEECHKTDLDTAQVVAVATFGSRAVVVHDQGFVLSLFDLEPISSLRRLEMRNVRVKIVHFVENNNNMVLLGAENMLQTLNLSTGLAASTASLAGLPTCLATSSKLVWVASDLGLIESFVVHVTSLVKGHRVRVHEHINNLDVVGDKVLAALSSCIRVFKVDGAKGALITLHEINAPSKVARALFGPSGVVVGGQDGQLAVYDGRTQKVLNILVGHGDAVHNLTFMHCDEHGLMLASADRMGIVIVWK